MRLTFPSPFFINQAKFHLAETKLKRLGPSVHCGADAMTLYVPGPRMPHFLVDKGKPIKPLFYMVYFVGF